ncbi:nuclear pore complex protein [Canna indica]|uniref:Nuclear pore complex protein n=1 Tax=Canna indica TaxID=4628 RepID=A0AAQ3L4U7_9LILI|nr:nuclear pore complex protein [Canna indica]
MAWEDDIVGSDVATAGLVISDRIAKEAAGHVDLKDALEASKLASNNYSSYPKDWPHLVEVSGTRELPSVLIERYHSAGGEGTALCGIFPEIHHAWASVDNSLYLWRIDKWDNQCREYSGEEHTISAVALVRSKPGIFVDSIQYLIVLATPVELLLIGVCCTRSGDETDPYTSISLQPLPEYRVSSDGVTMTCITCTDKGRIFMAGRDGHIYELLYSTCSVWHRHFHKICITDNLGSFVSRWILPNTLKFGSTVPISEMAVDNERHVLFARAEDMTLRLFDLGENGEAPVKRMAETKLIYPRDTQYSHTWSVGSRANTRADQPFIVCIAPLSVMESKWLQMVVVFSDGRRLYLSSSGEDNDSSAGFIGLSNAHKRPQGLVVSANRVPPPLGLTAALTFGTTAASARIQPGDLTLKVEAAVSSAGMLVLSDSSSAASSSLLHVNRDPSRHVSNPDNSEANSSSHALHELVSSLTMDGRVLFLSDIFFPLHTAVAVQSLYSEEENCTFSGLRESYNKLSRKLWSRGELSMQHVLPRRRIAIFSTTGTAEIVLNRPVDILRKLLESNAPRSQIEGFVKEFGVGEAAAMCLILAAKLIYAEENLISNIIAEKAAELFEDPLITGIPQFHSRTIYSSNRALAGGFSTGQVMEEAESSFSGAYEGLCLCSSRLLFPIWERPVMAVHREVGSDSHSDEALVCRFSAMSMQILESKLRSLENFIRSRRNERRGLYGYIAGLGDSNGFDLYDNGSDLVANSQSLGKNLLRPNGINADFVNDVSQSIRQQIPQSTAELAAMEVRAIECLRRLLRRSGEALFLLKFISEYHLSHLVQGLDVNLCQKLLKMTFHQLVCSEEGESLALQLISALMECYIASADSHMLDEVSARLQEGCPSYYDEFDYKYFQALERLERAATNVNSEEREDLARDAYNLLIKNPDFIDLGSLCKRFEDLRFYEAVVQLPLQKAQAVDPDDDAFNDSIDPRRQEYAFAQRKECYDIIMNALRSLKNEAAGSLLDQDSKERCIQQVIQLSVRWPDKMFHEHLYRTLIELNLENELLEYGASDLVTFLENAVKNPLQEVQAVTGVTSRAYAMSNLEGSISSSQNMYIILLAKYYVIKRQHVLAAHIFYRLAERQCADASGGPTLEERHEYLSNAVKQAKYAISSAGLISSSQKIIDDRLVDTLEAKLTVLQFQMKIKNELESLASRLEDFPCSSGSLHGGTYPQNGLMEKCKKAELAGVKAKELSLGLKSITQLYNQYAVPFQLWEVCLEILHFADVSGDADSRIVRETWIKLLDQSLARGGVAEACSVLKRVGSKLNTRDGPCLPLDTLCLRLERAALDELELGAEPLSDNDVASSLLEACWGGHENLLNIYNQLLSNRAMLPSSKLKLRLLQSILVILSDWTMSVLALEMDATTVEAKVERASITQGTCDKIITAVNRCITEVRRLALPENRTEAVYRGFRELEEKLLCPSFE